MFDETLFFGLQYILAQHFSGPVITKDVIAHAEEVSKSVFGTDKYFNRKGWEHILEHHQGFLPIRIKAVPEGLIVPTSNVLVTMENTDDAVPFITNFCESILLQTWYPVTVATLSWHIRKLINKFAIQTGTQTSDFHLNDFGLRGVSSYESAGIGGAAHLVNFKGTDNLPAIELLRYYYDAVVSGFSVFATEHSTTTVFGGPEHEIEAYRHFLSQLPEDKIGSFVVDSFDTLEAVGTILGVTLKDEIMKRSGKIVVRPDSGTPWEVSVQVLQMLWNRFGGTVNHKGFKVLDPHVGMIYGDGINYQSIEMILENVVKAGFCVSNLVFGMGGALLQQCNRDTQKFAFKCSWADVNGVPRDVWKKPVTDLGKSSKRGRLKLVRSDFGALVTQPEDAPGQDLLTTVFEDGVLLKMQSLEQIRALVATQG
jgi:nicotinamide phosphoribosyltransferase